MRDSTATDRAKVDGEALRLLRELIAEEDAVAAAELKADALGCEVNYSQLHKLKMRVREFIAARQC